MSQEICGHELVYGDGLCQYSPGDYPDNKCGLHTDYRDNPKSARKVQETLLIEFLEEEKKNLRDSNGNIKSTYDTRLTGIRAFDEWLEESNKDVVDIGPLSIKQFLRWLSSSEGRNTSDNTAEKYIEQVSKLFQYLKQKEEEEFGIASHFGENPVQSADFNLDTRQSVMAKNLKSEEGYVAFDQSDFDEFIQYIPAPKFRNRLLFSLVWDTGLRPIEATDIMLTDIEPDNREILIRSEKTHINRTVFYGNKVAQMLDIYLNGGERDRFLRSDESDYLFPTNQSDKITTKVIQTTFSEAISESNIENPVVFTDSNGGKHRKYTPYSLRHGFAERMIEKPEIDTVLLRDAMGHRSVQTTERYLNRDKETRRLKFQEILS